MVRLLERVNEVFELTGYQIGRFMDVYDRSLLPSNSAAW
jgi:hypothetical protein